MRQAHIIVTDAKGGHRLIGPGPVDQIRAEAAKLDSGTLYIDGRNPRKIGFKSADAYFALVAKENARMNEVAIAKSKAKATAKKEGPETPPKKNPESERIKELHNKSMKERHAAQAHK